MKFLIVDWPGNKMVGIFNNDGLGQVANTPKDWLLSELQCLFSVYDIKNAEIEFVDYEYIVNERTRRGLEFKPIL